MSSREDQCMIVTCYAKTFSVKFMRRRELSQVIKATQSINDAISLTIYEPSGDLLFFAAKTDLSGTLTDVFDR